MSQCRKNGVVFKRAVFKHIVDAAAAHHSGHRADVVVNCTSLSSKYLGGVEDQKLYPARGQVIVVRNEAPAMYSVSGTDDGPSEAGYIMTRAAGTFSFTTHPPYYTKQQVPWLVLTFPRGRNDSRRLLPASQLREPA